MASSGVTVQDGVVTEFNNIKIGHKYQYVQMKLTDDWKEIEVEKTVIAGAETFEQFVQQLPPEDCRYICFDFHFDTGKAGHREQLIFILWCPECAKVKTKMLYAASKDALKKKLVGINHEIQATEFSELNEKDLTEKILQKMVK
jgi:cofilin